MIEIKKVSKFFSKNKVINDLSLTINNGEVFGLLGPNGAGKSTTLKMIAGILKIDEGNILVDNNDISSRPTEAKETIGFVFDNPDMFLGMKGLELLKFISSIYKTDQSESIKEALNLANRLNMNDVLNNYINEYSHGMRQKIFIIASLMHNPTNWILDEPLVGLDPQSAFLIKNLMREKAKDKKCVLYSTHVLDVAEKVCDRVGIISKGNLLYSGTINDLRNLENKDADLESLFLELTKWKVFHHL